MDRGLRRFGLAIVAFAVSCGPAAAHHVMGGRMASTFGEGLLSGLAHPIIGLDHFAAMVAIGCLAAAHIAGARLAIGYVLAMIAGVAVHLQGMSIPAAEILVAVSVIVLGLIIVRERQMRPITALALFGAVGLLHGYALGESIYGAEPAPLYAYLLGLAVIQSVVVLGAMVFARMMWRRSDDHTPLRLAGAGIAGIGLAILVQQIVPGV